MAESVIIMDGQAACGDCGYLLPYIERECFYCNPLPLPSTMGSADTRHGWMVTIRPIHKRGDLSPETGYLAEITLQNRLEPAIRYRGRVEIMGTEAVYPNDDWPTIYQVNAKMQDSRLTWRRG